MNEKINIDELVSDLPPERLLTITRRALDSAGIVYVWKEGPPASIDIPEGAEDLIITDWFLDLWEREAAKMITADIMLKGIAQGLIEIDGVDENGEVMYKTVDGVDIESFLD